jgi:hypothetical protein
VTDQDIPAALAAAVAEDAVDVVVDTIPLEAIMAALPQVIDRAAGGGLRIGVGQVPLAEVTDAWRRGVPQPARTAAVSRRGCVG